MNKSIIVAAFTLFAFSLAYGQTNTFPTTGDVGIGTTNPRTTLEILKGSSGDALFLSSGINAGNSQVGIGFYDWYSSGTDGHKIGRIFTERSNSASDFDFVFSTRDQTNGLIERMRLTHDGGVVIPRTDGPFALAFDSDKGKRITTNDGNGNFNIRGNNYSHGGTLKYIANGGASTITLDQDNGNGQISLLVAPQGSAGGTVNYTTNFRVNTSGAFVNGNKVLTSGAYNLHNDMYGGVTFETVDFNQLQTVGEFRFVKLGDSNTLNKPTGTSGVGYYFGMGGGDYQNRGFQLLGTTNELFYRSMNNKVWHEIATQDWVSSQISNSSLWTYNATEDRIETSDLTKDVYAKKIGAQEGFFLTNGLGAERYGLKYGGENEVGIGSHLMLTNREANGHLYFGTSPNGGGNNEKIRMTILSDGDIGIGTLTPNLSGMGNSTNKAKVLTLDAMDNGDGISGMEFNSNRPNDGWGLGIIKFLHNSNTLSDFYATREAGGTRSAFIFRSTDGTNLVERMRLDENGKLGIGITEPSNLLHVSHDNGHQLLRLARSNTSSTGNDLNFDVASGSGLANIVAGAEKAANAGEDYQYTGTRGASRIRLHDGEMNFYTSTLIDGVANTNVTWHNPINFIGDKIGVGTDDPTSKLQINGDLKLRKNNNQIIHIFADGTSQNGEHNNDLIVQSAKGNGRTQIKVLPGGTKDVSFINVANSSNLENTGMGRLGVRNEYTVIGTGNSGTPSVEMKHIGIELDPADAQTGETFQITTGGYLGSSSSQERVLFHCQEDGKIGIGTTNPVDLFSVNGNIRAIELNVMPDITIPDYVFEPDYELPSLEEVEAYVQQHKHLPEIPSAAEIEAEGMQVGKMNALLLKKIEELTLYQIEQNKLLQQVLKENEALKKRITKLEE